MVITDPSIPPVLLPPTDFFDMVKTLPCWQSSLLAHLEDSEHHPDRLEQLLESDDKLKLCLVSDGGGKGDPGSWDTPSPSTLAPSEPNYAACSLSSCFLNCAFTSSTSKFQTTLLLSFDATIKVSSNGSTLPRTDGLGMTLTTVQPRNARWRVESGAVDLPSRH
jgi:hypothetical protein